MRLLLILFAALILTACAGAPPLSRAGQPAMAGRTVVITGASSGIGRGTAIAMAARGANVVLAARREAVLQEVAAEARQVSPRIGGGQALVVPTDVADPAAVARLATAAEQRFGRIDVWINDAGVGALGRFDEIPLADHSRIVDVNLKGVIHGSHEALRRFRQQRHGTLINLGSVDSRIPQTFYASYVATKHAILGLSEALNSELRADGLGRTVRVVTVMPWAVDTPWFDNAANYARTQPVKILPDSPDLVVNAIVHAALRPRDRVAPGLKAKSALVAHRLSPTLTNAVSGAIFTAVQRSSPPDPKAPTSGSLHRGSPAPGAVADPTREGSVTRP